jgi:uncharacterized membrane protein
MTRIVYELGKWHPALVHYPIALVVMAAAAELLSIWKKRQWFADAARFMVASAAWLSVPAAAAGFAAASGETFSVAMKPVFSVHWVAGTAVPVLTFLAYGLGEGTRRSGQVWEQMLYRLFLFLAAAGVLVAAYFGGILGHGHEHPGVEATDFSLTLSAVIWY